MATSLIIRGFLQKAAIAAKNCLVEKALNGRSMSMQNYVEKKREKDLCEYKVKYLMELSELYEQFGNRIGQEPYPIMSEPDL